MASRALWREKNIDIRENTSSMSEVNVHEISMGQPGNPYRRGMISAVVLLIPTSSD